MIMFIIGLALGWGMCYFYYQKMICPYFDSCIDKEISDKLKEQVAEFKKGRKDEAKRKETA